MVDLDWQHASYSASKPKKGSAFLNLLVKLTIVGSAFFGAFAWTTDVLTTREQVIRKSRRLEIHVSKLRHDEELDEIKRTLATLRERVSSDNPIIMAWSFASSQATLSSLDRIEEWMKYRESREGETGVTTL